MDLRLRRQAGSMMGSGGMVVMTKAPAWGYGATHKHFTRTIVRPGAFRAAKAPLAYAKCRAFFTRAWTQRRIDLMEALSKNRLGRTVCPIGDDRSDAHDQHRAEIAANSKIFERPLRLQKYEALLGAARKHERTEIRYV